MNSTEPQIRVDYIGQIGLTDPDQFREHLKMAYRSDIALGNKSLPDYEATVASSDAALPECDVLLRVVPSPASRRFGPKWMTFLVSFVDPSAGLSSAPYLVVLDLETGCGPIYHCES